MMYTPRRDGTRQAKRKAEAKRRRLIRSIKYGLIVTA